MQETYSLEPESLTEEPLELYLWDGQEDLLFDTTFSQHGVVSGNGYGKTIFGVRWFHQRVEWNKNSKLSIIAAPKDDLLRQINFPEYVEHLRLIGYHDRGRFPDFKTRMSPQMEIEFAWGHKVLFRSADKSAISKMVGYTASHGWIDESGETPDRTPTELAKRVRCKFATVRQRLYTGTPEGVKNWFYRRCGHLRRVGRFSFGKSLAVLHGTTYDNPMLPQQYIDDLEEEFAWNDNLRRAYLLGEFVPIYDFVAFDFDPRIHFIDVQPVRTRPVHLTWDFNVALVTWIAIQEANRDAFAVAENKGRARTTMDACADFIRQFPPQDYRDTEILVTGDPAGRSRDTRQLGNDYDIIKQELQPYYPLLRIVTPHAAPSVGHRIACTNRLLSHEYYVRLYLNKTCTKLGESLTTTTINKVGNIEKPQGETWTHPADALGYWITQNYPLKKPQAHKARSLYA